MSIVYKYMRMRTCALYCTVLYYIALTYIKNVTSMNCDASLAEHSMQRTEQRFSKLTNPGTIIICVKTTLLISLDRYYASQVKNTYVSLMYIHSFEKRVTISSFPHRSSHVKVIMGIMYVWLACSIKRPTTHSI